MCGSVRSMAETNQREGHVSDLGNLEFAIPIAKFRNRRTDLICPETAASLA